MKMDFDNYSYMNKRRTRTRGSVRWIGLSFIFVLLVGVAAFFAYQYKKQTPLSPSIASYYVRVKSWIAERKSHLHEGIVKVKKIAATKEGDEEIHFEFYNTLPNMQVNVAELATNNSSNNVTNSVRPGASAVPNAQAARPAVVAATVDAAKSQHDTPKLVKASAHDDESDTEDYADSADTQETVADKTPAPKVAATKKAANNSTSNNSAIVSADDLESDLHSEIKPSSHYIIQLGIFKNASSAEQYRISLMEAGFDARIATATVAGQNVFRVQVGPFANKDQVKLVQRQLVKKNLNGIMRKIDGEE